MNKKQYTKERYNIVKNLIVKPYPIPKEKFLFYEVIADKLFSILLYDK